MNRLTFVLVNIRRRQRLPEFADKVRKISECLRKFTANLEAEKNATGKDFATRSKNDIHKK